MVPEITTPHSLKRALNYNEKKVQKGQAELIHAANFLKLPGEMNFYDKLERFEKQMELNDRAKTKTIHISLNFHPSETQRLDNGLLVEITDAYMKKIGFENQPYLVYRHYDAGHPHVHVVSSLIRDDGGRINTHNLGRDISEPVRKELEQTYGLVKADKKEHAKEKEQQLAVPAQKVQYGKSETRRGITNVLDAVIDRYKYTSLAELNAVLKQYNVLADRGQEDGRIYKNKGLTYRILDENGQKVGVPIKASEIHNKPTLASLEKKFEQNELRRRPYAKQVKTSIDWVLAKHPETLKDFVKALEKERVHVAVRQNDKGFVYGLTYIDHKTKAVFNGSDLGKEYSAKKVLERLGYREVQEEKKEQAQGKTMATGKQERQAAKQPLEEGKAIANEVKEGVFKLAEKLTEAEQAPDNLPYELREDNYKKKKKEQDLHWQQEM